MVKRLFAGLVVTLAAIITWLALAPSPVDPASFEPFAAPRLQAALAPNEALRETELIARGELVGPEDVAVDGDGRIYGSAEDGRIVRIDLDGSASTFATTGGRPFGLAWDAAGNLIVADALAGLLSIDPAGAITVLTTEAEGLPFAFTDDVDVASDGTIYFTDASSRFGPDDYVLDLFEARPHGRLLAYDPATGKTRVLASDLYFANGVALSEREDFLLVNETYRYRILRHWLVGARAGKTEVFMDNLPGFPDGVASDRAGTFWVAMFTVRNPVADLLHPWPRLKRAIALLPRAWWPKPRPYGLVLALDEEGTIRRSLHDPGGEVVYTISSVEPVGDTLYFGTLTGDWIGRLALER